MEVIGLLTAEELAERLRVQPSTIREWRRGGVIPSVKISPKVIRYDIHAVIGAIENRQRAQGMNCVVSTSAVTRQPIIHSVKTIAEMAGVPVSRVRHAIKGLGISRDGEVGNARLYTEATAKRIAAEIQRIEDERGPRGLP